MDDIFSDIIAFFSRLGSDSELLIDSLLVAFICGLVFFIATCVFQLITTRHLSHKVVDTTYEMQKFNMLERRKITEEKTMSSKIQTLIDR